MSWQFCTESTIGQRMWTSSTDNSQLLQHNIHVYVCTTGGVFRVENVEMDGGNKEFGKIGTDEIRASVARISEKIQKQDESLEYERKTEEDAIMRTQKMEMSGH